MPPSNNASLLALLVFVSCCAAARAADWGYEYGEALSAPAAPAFITPRTPGKTASKPAIARPAAKPASAALPPLTSTQEIVRQNQAVECWQQLYSLVAPAEIASDEQERLRQYLLGKLTGNQAPVYQALCDYWPDVQKAMQGSLDQKNNYRDLFRALLRLQERADRGRDAAAIAEADTIAEVLGPLRIAVPGNPALTEDSINAYADMACFLFEQKNPGRTLDATDNRTLFAKMIVDKFKDAPTDKDRLAMINFDLSWAKFKILWADADPAHRQSLLQQWAGSGGTAGGAGPKNQTLEAVLSRGPWSASLGVLRGSGLQPQPQAATTKPNRISSSSKQLIRSAQ